MADGFEGSRFAYLVDCAFDGSDRCMEEVHRRRVRGVEGEIWCDVAVAFPSCLEEDTHRAGRPRVVAPAVGGALPVVREWVIECVWWLCAECAVGGVMVDEFL